MGFWYKLVGVFGGCIALFPVVDCAIAQSGTLTVQISNRCANGNSFVAAGQNVWVYAYRESADPGLPRRRLLGTQKIGVQAAGAAALTLTIPEGTYWVDLVKASDSDWPAFGVSESQQVIVTTQASAIVAFPKQTVELCYSQWQYPDGYDAWAVSASSNHYADLASELQKRQKWCTELSTPLQRIYGQVTNLRSSTVFIDSWVGSDGTYPDHVLLGREYDAAQIRRMVRALKYLCWTWAIDWPRPTSSEEAILAAKIREFVEAEKTNLDELNGIADALDAASRK